MKKKLRTLADNIGIILVIVAVIVGIGGCVNYRMNLYKRKYPGTTALDYWMDNKK